MEEKKKEQIVLTHSLTDLEKKLYKTNSLLHDLNELSNSLKDIQEKTSLLEELTESHPTLSNTFKKEISNSSIISNFKVLESNLSNLKKTIKRFEEPSFRADLFLDSFRTEATYVFQKEENALDFLIAVLKDQKTKEVFFGPKMIGVLDLKETAEKTGTEKISPSYLKVSTSKLSKVLHYVLRTAKPQEFVIDSPHTRIEFKNLKELSIKSSPDLIKKTDRLGKLLDAKLKEF